MEQVRPWQMIVVIAGALALSASIVYQCQFAGDRVEIADTVTLVDVKSGELIRTNKPSGRAMTFPVKNPATGTAMLFPVTQKDGKWFVEDLFMDQALKAVGKEDSALLDLKSGEVRTAGNEPKSVNLY